MKKITFLIINLLLIVLLFTACSNESKQLYLSSYPEKITSNESFDVKGEYLTEDPYKYEEVEILLSVKEVESDQTLLDEKKTLTEDKSQQFSFTDIALEKIEKAVYFELKLVTDGEYIAKVDSKDKSSFRADWKKDIITTYFDGSGETNSWGESLDKGNQYYFALPYRDFAFEVDGVEQENVGEDYYGIEDVKNRWIEIYYPEKDKYVYAQWRDVGPWNIYDPHYVFEDERPYAEMGIDMGWSGHYRETNKAGLDVSPEVMKYLIDQDDDGDPDKGKITTNWRLVDEEEVPDGPWKENVSTEKANKETMNLETETLKNLD
ncbi:MAG: hypothetical protein ACQEQF_06170 [Bacillota bacterium]